MVELSDYWIYKWGFNCKISNKVTIELLEEHHNSLQMLDLFQVYATRLQYGIPTHNSLYS